jgi:GNAT superfamily N-acetyltransferase
MFPEKRNPDAAGLDRMEAASEEYFRRALADGSYRSWLAETGGRVVSGGGIVVVRWPGNPDFPGTRRGWILNIYTEPEHRRRGIAKRIMETIVEWCREQGFYHVSLHASHAGRPVYESMGFRATNEMRLYLRS